MLKLVSILCALFLSLAFFRLPIGYYSFLRLTVTAGAILIVIAENKNKISIYTIVFGIVALLFNPVLPVYLYKKSIWIPIDTVCACLFVFYTIKSKSSKNV
jgi:membrane-bound ClpP family serine protease